MTSTGGEVMVAEYAPLTGADSPPGPELGRSAPSTMERPLPRLRVFAVCLCWLCYTFHLNSMWAMAPFMIRSYNITRDPDGSDTGLFVGMMATAFYGGQLCSQTFWGWICDRYGRRVVILLGVAGMGVTMLCLGLATTFSGAVLARLAGGMLNGIAIGVRSFMGDITDESNRERGFSLLSLGFGCGAVLGPLATAALADPASKYTALENVDFFRNFPFLLACGATTVVCVAAFVVAALHLPDPPAWLAARDRARAARACGLPRTRAAQADGEAVLLCLPLEGDVDCDGGRRGDDSWASKVCRRPVLLSVFGYCAVRSAVLWYDEAVPLLASTSTHLGGLDFSSTHTGILLASMAPYMILFQLFAYPRISRCCGSVAVFRAAAVLFGIYVLSTPSARAFQKLAGSSALRLWPYLLFQQGCKQTFVAMAFTSCMVIMTNATSSRNRGAVTGFCTLILAIIEACGPLALGAIWTWATTLPWADYHFYAAFAFPAAFSLLGFALSLGLSRSLDRPQREIKPPMLEPYQERTNERTDASEQSVAVAHPRHGPGAGEAKPAYIHSTDDLKRHVQFFTPTLDLSHDSTSGVDSSAVVEDTSPEKGPAYTHSRADLKRHAQSSTPTLDLTHDSTSGVDSSAVVEDTSPEKGPGKHPLLALLRAGVPCSLHADDPAFFGARTAHGLVREFIGARHLMGLSDADLAALASASVTHCLAPAPIKRRALQGIAAWLRN